MKVCHTSEIFTFQKTLILQLQLTLELSQIQEILSTYTNFLLLFAEYPSLFKFLKNEPNSLQGKNALFKNRFITQDPARDGGNWYGYCGNKPLTFTDLNGLQSIYLPGGGTTFNGTCPGMKYNMDNYTKESNAIGDFDLDKNGTYDDKEAMIFADYINNTMLLNYGDQTELGPYKDSVKLPSYTKEKAKDFLNETVRPNKNEIYTREVVITTNQETTNRENKNE